MRILLVLAVLLAAFLFWPSAPVNLREFQPAEFALREANAWRAYYEERYPALFWQVFQVTHAQYGFSLRDSLRVSFYAARGGATFRKSNKPEDIAFIREELEKYYQIVSEASRRPFDYKKAAELELQWWRQRRQKLPQEEWAKTISRQCEIIYGEPYESFLPSVRLRVAAMADRDSKRNSVMTEGDWQRIQAILLESSNQFWNVLHPAPDGGKS